MDKAIVAAMVFAIVLRAVRADSAVEAGEQADTDPTIIRVKVDRGKWVISPARKYSMRAEVEAVADSMADQEGSVAVDTAATLRRIHHSVRDSKEHQELMDWAEEVVEAEVLLALRDVAVDTAL
jgi:hypothetical protein